MRDGEVGPLEVAEGTLAANVAGCSVAITANPVPPRIWAAMARFARGNRPRAGDQAARDDSEDRMRPSSRSSASTPAVIDTYAEFLEALGAVRSQDLLRQRSRSEILVAGVKVATQTPPIRSGRRVVFLTLDDGSGPVDATFFEDAQGPYAATLFHSWLLVVRGELRRTGPKGVSLRATGCWELTAMYEAWKHGGPDGGSRRSAPG